MDRQAEQRAAEELRQWLEENGGYLEQKKDVLVDLLESAWPLFDGATDEGMQVDKLSRLEAPKWSPPNLSYTIERHGAIVAGGSTRAELQRWECNLDDLTVQCQKGGWRQVRRPEPNLNVREIAYQIAQAVARRDEQDPRLKWKGDQVRIVLKQISGLAEDTTVLQTRRDRRKRFRAALADEMRKIGFVNKRGTSNKALPYVFVPER